MIQDDHHPRGEHRRFRNLRLVVPAGVALGLVACHSVGPRQVPIDRFDYNAAIASSSNEQMLANLVRLRYGEVPVFLAVSSVLTQYTWTGDVGVSGAGGESLGFPAWSVGGSAGYRYIERPTVTYIPLSGQEFATQLISPVRADLVFSLVASGWPPKQLLDMTLQRFNDIQNVSLASLAEGNTAPSHDLSHVIDLLIELAKHSAVELTRSPTPGTDETFLEFTKTPDAEAQPLIAEFKSLTGLDPGRSRYRVTRKIIDRAPDEVTIRMHSLVELMGVLSAGVEAPADSPLAAKLSDTDRPLSVVCGRERPMDAFISVQYAGNWFSIPRSDESSKRAFGLLIYLFQMQASQNQGAAPLLTVSTG